MLIKGLGNENVGSSSEDAPSPSPPQIIVEETSSS